MNSGGASAHGPFSTYKDALAWLYGLQRFGIKLGLENIARLLRELCSELCANHRAIAGRAAFRPKVIHVAGTNGKGSVCAMIDSVCRAQGYRTGLFTSPHLVTFRERIRLNGEMVTEEAVAGDIVAGDDATPHHVDVLVGFNLQRVDRNGVPVGSGQGRPVIKVVMEDITVLTVPGSSGGGIGGGGRGTNVTLNVTPEQAADLAFAADHGKIWLILRPRSGAAGEAPELVTAETMLLGVPAVAALDSFGGRR